MKLRSTWLLVLALAACRSSKPTPVASTVDAAPAPSAAPSADASATTQGAGTPALTPEQRATYAKALAEGRREQRAHHWDRAVTAFDQAIVAIPEDARALAEGGYARYERAAKDGGKTEKRAEDLQAAKSQLELAALAVDPSDRKLAAQIEYNLGLVCEKLVDEDIENGDLRGVAAGHFRRPNDLAPTNAAASRMIGCPLGIDVPDVKIFASRAAFQADAGADLEEHDFGSDVYFQSATDETEVAVPIEGGRYAAVRVGPTTVWRCGVLGTVNVTRDEDVWQITYEAHRVSAGSGMCWCADENTTCSPSWQGVSDPPCPCKEMRCQSTCGNGVDEEGAHEVVLLDRKSGRGVLDLGIDHAFLSMVHIDLDTKARRLAATELGCAIDIRLPPTRPSTKDGGTK